MYVCVCRAVKESELRARLTNEPCTPETLVDAYRWDAEDCCGRCLENLREAQCYLERTGSTAECEAICPLNRRARQLLHSGITFASKGTQEAVHAG
jgi:bacterioferritin-associated ferredoxin